MLAIYYTIDNYIHADILIYRSYSPISRDPKLFHISSC